MKPGDRVDLSRWDPDDCSAVRGGKKAAQLALDQANEKLEELQELLYAEHAHRVLVVLQGMDTAGKDAVIRHVFQRVSPQGVRVASFKAPTSVELDHDYLWRVHKEVPGRGEIAIFNRSHYEDVLVARVHGQLDASEWKQRYHQINEFERMLVEEGAIILKFFLHISKDEQRERLRERLADPRKGWKFSMSDVQERALWDEYVRAYEDLLAGTSTKHAPWFVVPANKRWHRNLVVARAIVAALEDLSMSYPPSAIDPATIVLD